MTKQNKRFVIYVLLGISVAIFSISMDNYEDLYRNFLNSVGQSSTYKMMLKQNSMAIEEGKVGDFHECMGHFRSGHRWTKTNDGKSKHRYLVIDDKYLLRMGLYGSEVVRLSLLPITGSGNVSIVAINCDLSLLNKI